MDQLTTAAALRIAELSRIELSSVELAQLTSELNQVLKVFAALDGIPADDDSHYDARSGLNFEEVASRVALSSRLRPDEWAEEDAETAVQRAERLRAVFPKMWEQSLEVPLVLNK